MAIWSKQTRNKLYISYLEQQDHTLSKGFEVVDIIESTLLLTVHEKGHSEYGEDKHYQEKQQADVEERRQGHGQGEQQRSDSFGTLHQA